MNSLIASNGCFKAKKSTNVFGYIFVVFSLFIYLFPLGVLNAYIPYILIGILFVFSIIQCGISYKAKSYFFIFSIYSFVVSILMSSLLFNYSFLETIKTSIFIFVPYMSFYIGLCLFKKGNDLFFKRIIIAVLFIELVVCFLQVYGNSFGFKLTVFFGPEKYATTYYTEGFNRRAIGSFGNPNSCAVGCSMLLVFPLTFNKNKLTKLILIIVVSVIVLLTRSRTGLINLFFVIFLCFTHLFDNRYSLKKKILLSLIGVFVVLIILRVFTIFIGRDLSSLGMEDRVAIWQKLIDNSYSNGFQGFVERLFGLGLTRVKSFENTDNEYLFFVLSTGVFGVIVLMVSVLKLIIDIFKISNQQNKQVSIIFILLWAITAITAGFFTTYLLCFVPFVYIGYSISENTINKIV